VEAAASPTAMVAAVRIIKVAFCAANRSNTTPHRAGYHLEPCGPVGQRHARLVTLDTELHDLPQEPRLAGEGQILGVLRDHCLGRDSSHAGARVPIPQEQLLSCGHDGGAGDRSPQMAAENGLDQMTGDVDDKVRHFRDTEVSELGAGSASPIGQRACLPASAPTGWPTRYAAVSGDPAVFGSDRLVVEWRRRM